MVVVSRRNRFFGSIKSLVGRKAMASISGERKRT
jgi:hypothetical protein